MRVLGMMIGGESNPRKVSIAGNLTSIEDGAHAL